MKALGLPGRMFPAWIKDHWLGPQHILLVVVTRTCVLTYPWIAVESLTGLGGFADIFEFVAANIQSTTAPTITGSGRDPTKIGVEVGMIFSIIGIGCLYGPPIAGALIECDGGHYLGARIYAGSVILRAALAFLVVRIMSIGWSWRKA